MTVWVGAKDDCEVCEFLEQRWSAHHRLTGRRVCLQAGNGVFDMGQFVDQHPGGSNSITRNCGKQVFNWAATNAGHDSYVYVPIVAGEPLGRSN